MWHMRITVVHAGFEHTHVLVLAKEHQWTIVPGIEKCEKKVISAGDLSGWWVLAILCWAQCAWALTREWVLSIGLCKTATWALTREWALARDTTVMLLFCAMSCLVH